MSYVIDYTFSNTIRNTLIYRINTNSDDVIYHGNTVSNAVIYHSNIVSNTVTYHSKGSEGDLKAQHSKG